MHGLPAPYININNDVLHNERRDNNDSKDPSRHQSQHTRAEGVRAGKGSSKQDPDSWILEPLLFGIPSVLWSQRAPTWPIGQGRPSQRERERRRERPHTKSDGLPSAVTQRCADPQRATIEKATTGNELEHAGSEVWLEASWSRPHASHLANEAPGAKCPTTTTSTGTRAHLRRRAWQRPTGRFGSRWARATRKVPRTHARTRSSLRPHRLLLFECPAANDPPVGRNTAMRPERMTFGACISRAHNKHRA